MAGQTVFPELDRRHGADLVDIVFDDASLKLSVQTADEDVIADAVVGTEEKIAQHPIDGRVDHRLDGRYHQTHTFHLVELRLSVEPENSPFCRVRRNLIGRPGALASNCWVE